MYRVIVKGGSYSRIHVYEQIKLGEQRNMIKIL